MAMAIEAISAAIRERRRGYICITGVHGVMESQRDPEVKRIHNQAFLVTPDGTPMVWLNKLRGKRFVERVYGPDLMLEVCRVSAERRFRHFFYGGTNGVTQRLKQSLEKRFPGLEVVGVYEPPFRPLSAAEEAELSRLVDSVRPDIIWVGISTPKQERFMAEYLPKLNTVLMVGVGAAFDMHSGEKKQCPRWLQRCGLEWFYRLCQEPKRLWRRYLANNPKFVLLTICQFLGLKNFPMETGRVSST
jgi:N-acetylglucosaminyldiphosphoundecaprenol N-acetyl-beta-D-mannosaminyltransferase